MISCFRIGGATGGTFWSKYGWPGVIGMISCFLIVGILFSLRVASITKAKDKVLDRF